MNVRLQTARERQQRSGPNRDVVILASEATRLTLENAQLNLRSRSTLMGHLNAIDQTAESAQEYIQRTRQQLETYEEEIWTTVFTPTIDSLVANLSVANFESQTFQLMDDQTVRMPLPHYTDVLRILEALQASIQRENDMHQEQVQSHRNTLSRVDILLTSLKSARKRLIMA